MYPATNARVAPSCSAASIRSGYAANMAFTPSPIVLKSNSTKWYSGARALGDRANVGRRGAEAEVAKIGVEVGDSNLSSGLDGELYVDWKIGHLFVVPLRRADCRTDIRTGRRSLAWIR